MIAALTTAADIAGLSTTVQTLLVGALAFPIGFVAFRLIKKSLRAAA